MNTCSLYLISKVSDSHTAQGHISITLVLRPISEIRTYFMQPQFLLGDRIMQNQTSTHIQAAPAKFVYTQPKLELHPEYYNIVAQSPTNGGGLPDQGGGGIGGFTKPLNF